MIENPPVVKARPTLLPYVEPTPGILIRVCVVIVQIVKKIFSILFFWWPSRPSLTKKEHIEALKEIQKKAYSETPYEPLSFSRNSTNYSSRSTTFRYSRLLSYLELESSQSLPAATIPVNIIKSDYEEVVFPEPLQKMRRFMSEFISGCTSCAIDKILPPLEMKDVYFEQVKESLKLLSSFIIQVGGHIKNPVFETMTKHGIRIHTEAIFLKSLKKVLNWLIKEDSSSTNLKLNIVSDLKKNVDRKIEEGKLTLNSPFEQERQRIIKKLAEIDEKNASQDKKPLLPSIAKRKRKSSNNQENLAKERESLEFVKGKIDKEITLLKEKHLYLVVNWIFDTGRPKEIDREGFIGEMIDAYYEECISLLVDAKIELLLSDLKLKIVDKLPSIIEVTLKRNTAILTEELSGRIADLFVHMDLSEMIDKLTLAIDQHITTFIQAKNDVREEIKHSSNDKELEAEELKAIAYQFGTYETAHPVLKQILTVPKGRSTRTWNGSKEFSEWKKSHELNLLNDLVKRLVSSLLPSRVEEIDGRSRTITGLQNLWRRLELPEELKNLGKEIEQFVKHFLPEEFTFAEDVKELISRSAEQIIPTIIETHIQLFSSHLLFMMFETFITPQAFSQFMADSLLPVLEEQCQDILMRNVYCKSLNKPTSTMASNLNELKLKLTECQKIEVAFFESFKSYFLSDSLAVLPLTKEEKTALLETFFNIITTTVKNTPPTANLLKTILSHLRENQILQNFAPKSISQAFSPFLKQSVEPLKQLRTLGNLFQLKRQEIASEIFHLMESKISEYKKNSGDLKEEAFIQRIALPFIHELEKVLIHESFNDMTESEAVILYLTETVPGAQEKDYYYAMIDKLCFKIGEYGSWVEKALALAKKPINQSISASLQPLREDYALIDLFVSKLQKAFPDKKAIKTLLERREEPPLSPKSFGRSLDKEIHRISGLVHDIFRSYANTGGWTGFLQTCAMPFVLGNSGDIENLIKKVYNQLFQHEHFNLNLFAQITDVFSEALKNSTLQIKNERTAATLQGSVSAIVLPAESVPATSANTGN